MIYTDFYVKDIPESLSLCVQLFEVVRKERPKSKNKKEDETAKRHDGQMMYRGWPEFIDLIKENRPDEKKVSNCKGDKLERTGRQTGGDLRRLVPRAHVQLAETAHVRHLHLQPVGGRAGAGQVEHVRDEGRQEM